MTPEEVQRILAIATAMDDRLTQPSPDGYDAQVALWTDALDGIPFKFCADFLQKRNRTVTLYKLQPGEIRQDWLINGRIWERQQRESAEREESGDIAKVIPHVAPTQPEFVPITDRQRDALLAAIPQGDGPDDLTAVAWSESLTNLVNAQHQVAHMTDERLAHEQRCRTDGCPCDHLDCYAGFLKAEYERTDHGQVYAQVRRCPTCSDALELLAPRR